MEISVVNAAAILLMFQFLAISPIYLIDGPGVSIGSRSCVSPVAPEGDPVACGSYSTLGTDASAVRANQAALQIEGEKMVCFLTFLRLFFPSQRDIAFTSLVHFKHNNLFITS